MSEATLATGLSDRRRRPVSFEKKVWRIGLLCGLPGVVAVLILLQTGGFSGKTVFTVIFLMTVAWLGSVYLLFKRVVRPIQTAANMLSAMREGDFSMQAGSVDEEDALGQLMGEINSISNLMRDQRLGAVEAGALLNKVVEEIDVAFFTFDPQERLKSINPAGEKLLLKSASQVVGMSATELGLEALLHGDIRRPIEFAFPARFSRWGFSRGGYRDHGIPQTLLLVADLSQPLREEERMAWKRLIRVLGHELNNSLAPIKSLSTTLAGIARMDPLPEDWRTDMAEGLEVISGRSEKLSRFMEGYSRIARLPPPNRERLVVGDFLRRLAALETRAPVAIVAGPDCAIEADAGQLEQLVINLLKNAVEAVSETNEGGIRMGWTADRDAVEIWIEDDGPGIANPSNLFTPFYSTKKGGSGIGLALSRQIADAHDGTLTIANRQDARGCLARLRLPVRAV
ncbi:MAG: ATP-binding protein [Opitutaceae bacterium]